MLALPTELFDCLGLEPATSSPASPEAARHSQAPAKPAISKFRFESKDAAALRPHEM